MCSPGKIGANFPSLFHSRVLFRYNNKSYRIDDIDFNQTPNDTFVDHYGREKKYKDYYKEHYNLEIKDLKQPLLMSRAKVSHVSFMIHQPDWKFSRAEENHGGGGRCPDHPLGPRAVQPDRSDGHDEGRLQGDEGRGSVHQGDSHPETRG